MGLFIGTLIIVGLCCLVMALGQILDGKPLAGGCGRDAGDRARCESCPNRKTRGDN